MQLIRQKLALEAEVFGHHRTLILAAAFFLVNSASAWSSVLCPGEYHIAAVGTWPNNPALNVPLEISSAAGDVRASVFRSALQQSGVRIDSASPIRLQMLVSVASFESTKGGDSTPRLIDTGFNTLQDAVLSGSSLSITAAVTDQDKYQEIWVATMGCTIQTDDGQALVHDIGVDLGRLLSESIKASH